MLSSPSSQAVGEQQCMDRSPSGSSAEVQIRCIAATGSWGPDYGLQRRRPSAWQESFYQ